MGESPPSTAPRTESLSLHARFRLGLSALKLAWLSSRSETVLVLSLQALVGLSFPLQLLAGKWALDQIVEAAHPGGGAGTGTGTGKPIPGPHQHDNIKPALIAVAVALAVITVGRLLGALARHRQRLFPQLVRQTVHMLIGEKANTLDMLMLETPSFADKFSRVQREAAYRPGNMVYDMMLLVATGFSIGSLVILVFTIQPLLALVVPFAFIPPLLASVEGGRAFYHHMVRNTPKERLIGHLGDMMTAPNPAKETRAFALGGYFLKRQQGLFAEQTADLRRVIRTTARRELLGALVSAGLTGAAVLFTVWLYFEGQLSVGDTIASAGALLLVSIRLNFFVMSATLFYENVLFLEDLNELLELQPTQAALPEARRVEPLIKLTMNDVDFSYPQGRRPAIRGVSLELRAGEMVALVGENGAGKTTLAKLICRLYDPDAGAIMWNGVDVMTHDPEEYRRQIGAIFQDFNRYELSAQENVGLGDADAVADFSRVVNAAQRAEAHAFLSQLPQGYETTLGKLFDQGHELSVGQWQRVALARAFFREARLVIMDEPTAALDARAEAKLFETMRELFADRSVLLISHRFSSVRMADRIYVLREGQVVEEGNHEELMASRGLYAELFTLQATAYAEEKAV